MLEILSRDEVELEIEDRKATRQRSGLEKRPPGQEFVKALESMTLRKTEREVSIAHSSIWTLKIA